MPLLRVLPLIAGATALTCGWTYGWYIISCLLLRNRIARREKILADRFVQFFAQSNALGQLRIMQDPSTLAQELTAINRKIRNKESDMEIVQILTKRLSEPDAINKFQQLTDDEVVEILLEIDPDPMKSQLHFWEWFRKN